MRKKTDRLSECLKKKDEISDEYERLSKEVYGNVSLTIDKIDNGFKEQTGLSKQEIGLVFLATALQCARIIVLNNLTKIEKAGSKNFKENFIHQKQKKILQKFSHGDMNDESRLYYASLQQIIVARGVPYDATGYVNESYKLFKGANHRFSTLGHDPVLGLVIGTANILTNTITCINKPVITTNHVIYGVGYKDPKIGEFALTTKMIDESMDRMKKEREAVIAAVIKQICHIGTDMYTPCGIQLPMANLIFEKETVEKITKIVSTGDVLKTGASLKTDHLINLMISVIHALLIKGKKEERLFEVRNRKIIVYSNLIATGSNVICAAIEGIIGYSTGNINTCMKAAKSVDVGGIIEILKRLVQDEKYIYEVKREFYVNNFNSVLK